MGKRGPAPKPSALEKLQGNPSKRPINSREPGQNVTNERLASAPAHLDPVAKKEWRRVAKKLQTMGLFLQVDRAVLALYCVAWSRWVEAEEKVKKIGPVIKTKNGNLVHNPYLNVANRAMEQVKIFARELGMTPSARSSIQAQLPEKVADPLADFFAMVK